MSVSAIGDVGFGLTAYLLAGLFHPIDILLFSTVSIPAAMIFVGFAVIAGSLAFFMGNAQYASQQMTNGLLTFALYPHTLFSGMTRFMLYTIIPAAFIGAVPVEIVKGHDGVLLLFMWVAATVIWAVAIAVFYIGLRRYESGSAINANV